MTTNDDLGIVNAVPLTNPTTTLSKVPETRIVFILTIWISLLLAIWALAIEAQTANKLKTMIGYMFLSGVESASIFICGMLLAYCVGYLAIRVIMVILIQGLFLLSRAIVSSVAIADLDLVYLSQMLFVYSLGAITIGVLLAVVKICGYTLLQSSEVNCRQAKVLQGNVALMLEFIVFASAVLLSAGLLQWEWRMLDSFEFVILVTLGQGLPALLILVPRYTAWFRYGLAMLLWILLLMLHVWSVYMTAPSYDAKNAMIDLSVVNVVAANVIAMTCFILRARGYRLMHFASTAV